MKISRSVLSLYIVGHFIVDFACAFLLYRIVYDTNQWYTSLLYYNFCAFALQMPFGLLADKWNKNSVYAALGCGLVALAYGIGNVGTVMAVIIAGIGNGLFHVGAGIDVLNNSREKSFLLGIFVSPGALGIYLGMVFGKGGTISIGFVIFALLAAGLLILTVYYAKRKSFQSDNEPVSFQGVAKSGVLVAIGCLFAVVLLRSYFGMVSNFAWKGQGVWGVLLLCAIVFGKMSGGFLADRLGAKKASVISLGFAAVLYMFSSHPVPGVAAVFFFNMTMPITLWALTRILKGSKGFSFGLLTFGLFLGFAPVYLELPSLITTSVAFSIASLGSLALLWLGLRKAVA